jgi:hypothetical protein
LSEQVFDSLSDDQKLEALKRFATFATASQGAVTFGQQQEIQTNEAQINNLLKRVTNLQNSDKALKQSVLSAGHSCE